DLQGELFAAAPPKAVAAAKPAQPPAGWLYCPAFLDEAFEQELLVRIAALPLHAARYKAYTAKRRIVSFGTEYDFDSNQLLPGAVLPDWLEGLRARCAAWQGLEPEAFSSALVAEYSPGTPLGWHRDVPDFETVVGVSLASSCRMRLRPY